MWVLCRIVYTLGYLVGGPLRMSILRNNGFLAPFLISICLGLDSVFGYKVLDYII
jgi:hypothetical protein